MRRAAFAILACVALAGCAGDDKPAAGPVAAPPVVRCGTVTPFSKEQQEALAEALMALPADSPVWQMERDWETMRDEARACAQP